MKIAIALAVVGLALWYLSRGSKPGDVLGSAGRPRYTYTPIAKALEEGDAPTPDSSRWGAGITLVPATAKPSTRWGAGL